MQGLAVTFVAPRQVEVREQKVPEPKDGQLPVRTLYSGISAGTEMLATALRLISSFRSTRRLPGCGLFSYPFCYGYSCVGRVLATQVLPFREASTAYAAVDHGEPRLLHAALDYRLCYE
jgi:hypothetical protein